MQKVPFMLVLGDKELEENKIAVRERKQGDIGQMTLEEFKEMAQTIKRNARYDEWVSSEVQSCRVTELNFQLCNFEL